MNFKEVKDPELWKKLQVTMMEAMAIFVFTIFIGILNAVDLVDFTRAEILFHLHSGTIGWISLSAVALLVWYFVGDRDLDEQSTKMAKSLLTYVQRIIPIYVLFFYLGFALAEGEDFLRITDVIPAGKGWFLLLVLGAIAATGGFFYTFYFGYSELAKLEVKETPHYLFLGAMLTSTYGGLFGMVLEIQNLLGTLFFDAEAGQDGTASHAAAMEAGFLFMMITGIIEWQVRGDGVAEFDVWGKLQVGALFLAGFTVSIGAGFNILPLVMMNLPLSLIGFITFLVRIGRKLEPRSLTKTTPDRYFIPVVLFMAISVAFFLYLVSQIAGGKEPTELFESHWFRGALLAQNHALFIGATTGAIFSSILVMFKDSGEEGTTLENIGFALMYIGLIGFVIVLLIRGDARENGTDNADLRTDIASLMGIGLYLIMYSLYSRFRSMNS